jgi:hypothetical protein
MTTIYSEENFINEATVKQLTGDLISVIPNLEGECIENSRSYDKKLCELTKGLLIHENRTYWDAVTPYGAHVENKKCKGSMWFNLGRYAQIYLKLDEDSKIETFTAIYKYNGSKVTEILLIETQNLTQRLLKNYIKKKAVGMFYEMYKLCDLPHHSQAQLSYKEMEKLASSKISLEAPKVPVTKTGPLDSYLSHGQRVKVSDESGHGVYDAYYKTIGFGPKQYKSPSGFAKAVSGKPMNGWKFVLAEVKDGRWVTLDEIRKKFCELA